MNDKKAGKSSQAHTDQDIERVRDIILGPTLRDYDGQLRKLQRELARLQKGVDELAEQLADQSSSQSQKLRDLRRDLRRADTLLRRELRQNTETLETYRVERAALGEFFSQLGASLKAGASLADLLAAAVETDPE